VASNIAAIELRVLRANTRQFIRADPRDVILLRTPTVDTGAGTTRPGTPAPLPSQTLRLLPQAESTSTERRLPDGTVVVPTWVLLGEHTADLQRGDVFDLPEGAGTGEVVYVHEKKAYQVKGEVIARGPH
jgi:hypothetical protein